jgi:hypothetical protein
MLQLTAEMEQLSIVFAKNGIQALFLKGPVLAFDLYKDISMRTSKDLDILIPLKELDQVNQILLDHGYQPDQYTRTVLDDWKWKNHHIEYFHANKGVSVEIHWRMNPGPGKEPSFKELWDRKRRSPCNYEPVYFLGREDLFVYLIIHGARHGWFRLRWLTDIVQLAKLGLNWEEVNALLKNYHYEHIAGQVQILTSEIFNVKQYIKLITNGNKKKSNTLAKQAIVFINQLENLHQDNLSRDLSKKFNHYLFRLMTFQQKLIHFIGYIFPVPADAERLPLPEKLHFLYIPLRPVLWVWRKSSGKSVSMKNKRSVIR